MASAPVFSLQVNAGTSFTEPLQWQINGVNTPITGHFFHCEVRDNQNGSINGRSYPAQSPVVLFAVDWQETLTDAEGRTNLSFLPEQTKLMKRRAYYYIVNMTDTTGFIRRILEGEIGVTQ